MDLMLLATANATNGTHPAIVSGVSATSQSATDSIDNAQAAAQLTQMQTVAGNLKKETVANQHKYWSTLTKDEQLQLTSAGYDGPPAPQRSLWGNITHYASDVYKTPLHIASDVMNFSPVHAVTHVAGAPLRAVQHWERAATQVMGNQTEAVASHLPDTGIGRIFSLKDWTQAWNTTSNGEQYIDPLVQRDALKQYGQQTFNVAYRLATGATPQELLAQYQQGTPQYQQLLTQINDPKTQEATKLLTAGHISPGRSIVGASFIAKHPGPGNFLSGGIDALFDWYTDPLNVGLGHAVDAAHARFVVSTPEDVARLYADTGRTGEAVRAGFSRLAQAVASNSLQTVQREFPQLKGAAEQLIQAEADTQEKVYKFFHDQAQVVDLIKGSPMNTAGQAGGVLPHLSTLGQLRLAAKAPFHKVIDFAQANPAAEVANHIAADDWYYDDNDVFHTVLHNEPMIASKPVSEMTPADRLKIGSARLFRSAVTLIPQHPFLNLTAPDATNVLADVMRPWFPSNVVDKVITEYAKAPDVGQRLRLFRSTMIHIGVAAGMDKNPELWDEFIGRLDQTAGRMYAPNGWDIKTVEGRPSHFAVLKNQMSQGVALPDFRKLYMVANQAGLTQALTRGMNAQALDKAMGLWRPLTLAHEGFALRVGGEEAARFAIAEGPVAYLKAAAMRSALKAGARNRGDIVDQTAADLTDNQAAAAWDSRTAHLTHAVKDSIHNVKDLFATHMGDLTARAASKIEPLLPEDMRAAIDAALAQDDFTITPEDITAMHGGGYDPNDITGSQYIKIRQHGKLVNAELSPTGDFQAFNATDPNFVRMWYRNLHMAVNDDWGREALYSRNIPWADRVNSLADLLLKDPKWKDHLGSTQDRVEHLVATDETTPRAVAQDHAAMILHTVDDMTHSPNGKEIKGLVDHMLQNGKPPSLPVLSELPGHLRPKSVVGPEMVPVTGLGGKIDKLTNSLFTKIIGPQINWISRQPMYWYNYYKGRQAYAGMAKVWADQGMDENEIAKLVHENARDRAFNDTIKYVHNPQLRSELSVLTRNLSPFWFAQEQFFKRWARTFRLHPDAFRKAQLMASGVRHSGFVHTDAQTGQQYFVYPGSALVQTALTHALSPLFGANSPVLPIAAGMTGQLNALSPGLERLGLPSFGPVAVVPMNLIKQIDPNMSSAIDRLEGPISANSGYIKALIPSTVMHAAELFIPSLDQAQLASATMQAAQALEATGHGMSFPATTQVTSTSIPDPKPGDYVLSGGNVGASAYVYQPNGQWVLNDANTLDKYLKRVQNYARIFLLTRLIYGFNGPASPQTQFNPSNLHNDLNTAIAKYGITEGLQIFMAAHPDATPYTVFQSQSYSGGFLPATKASQNFLDSNPDLMSKHALAASYFIPQPDTLGKFDYNAYREQMAEGARQKKTPQDFYQQIVYQQAANIYFKVDDAKNAAIANHTAPSTQIYEQWNQWSAQFMQANPIFAALLGSGPNNAAHASGKAGRMQIMNDVAAAIQDGSAPENTQTAALKALYNTWAAWQSMVGNFSTGTPSASAQEITQVNEQYALWLQAFVKQHPGVQPLVDRAIRPDLNTALTDLATQGQAVSF